MYLSDKPENVQHGETFAKVGNVQLLRYKNSIRLGFRYLKKRYFLTISGLDKLALKAAIAKAQIIDADISFDRLDTTLVKYDPKRAVQLETVTVELKLNLKDIWEQYKVANAHKVAKTTQKNTWKTVNNALDKLEDKYLILSNSDLVVSKLLELYAKSTVKRIGEDLQASLNWAIEAKKIKEMPYYGFNKISIPKSNTAKQTYSNEEIKRILQAFKDNKFCSVYAAYKHSFYTNFVECLALTGRRPEDIIALTWDDLINHHGKIILKIDKAYSLKECKSTKNEQITLYPVNQQLLNCLNRNKIDNPNNLIFPSQELNYIDQHNFSQRIWKKIIEGLIEKGELTKYLPPYNLRHSRATNLIRSGIDLQSVAALLETSIEMLSKHYLEGDTGIDLPEM